MKKFGLILLSVFMLGGIANAAQTIYPPPTSGGQGLLKDSAGKIWPLDLVATTDGNGNIISGSGQDIVKAVRTLYASTNVTTGAYVTLIASTSAQINHLGIFDSSGQTLALSYAASCGVLSLSTNTMLIFPGGNGQVSFQIPAGDCVGIIALSATASAGESDINFSQ